MMRKFFKRGLAGFVLACAMVTAVSQTPTPPAPVPSVESAGEVVVVPLKGEVCEAQFIFLRRALKEAERNHAEAVVLDMDTYGGSLQSAVDMQEALTKMQPRTITYINPNAGSAGALIAIST